MKHHPQASETSSCLSMPALMLLMYTLPAPCSVNTLPTIPMGLLNAAAAAFRVGSASTLLLGGQASTVGQAGTGFGIWVDSGGAVFWDDSLANASDHMDFDSPSADTKIGGTTKTLAALGSSGYAEAVKLATIAPREVTP